MNPPGSGCQTALVFRMCPPTPRTTGHGRFFDGPFAEDVTATMRGSPWTGVARVLADHRSCPVPDGPGAGERWHGPTAPRHPCAVSPPVRGARRCAGTTSQLCGSNIFPCCFCCCCCCWSALLRRGAVCVHSWCARASGHGRTMNAVGALARPGRRGGGGPDTMASVVGAPRDRVRPVFAA